MIAVDAGHGLPARGAVANGLAEHKLNLHLARLIASKTGWVQTRQGATIRTRKQRNAAAGDARLVVAIHHNANPDPSVHGAECYVFPGARDGWAGLIANAILHEMPAELQSRKLFEASRNDWTRRAFHVLSGFSAPCVLVEVGYLTNPLDAAYIGRNDTPGVVAEAIIRGVRRWADG